MQNKNKYCRCQQFIYPKFLKALCIKYKALVYIQNIHNASAHNMIDRVQSRTESQLHTHSHTLPIIHIFRHAE